MVSVFYRELGMLQQAEGDFRFLYTGETKLNDGLNHTRNTMSAAAYTGMDCVIHGGNVVNGGSPQQLTMRLMAEEYAAFAACAGDSPLLPVQGEADGWRSERYLGQIVWGIMTDEAWTRQTAFLNRCSGVSRPAGRPYYYIDFPDSRVRVIVLCSHFYQIDEQAEIFQKYRGLELEQCRWLAEEALNAPRGYTVLLVSYRIPGSCFEGDYMWSRQFTAMTPISRAKQRGVNVAGWICCGYGRDACEQALGVNLISRDMSSGTAFDACVLDTRRRTLQLIRFGSGEDCTVQY